MGISGTWFNELGSKMNLVASGGQLSGQYATAVGNASGLYDLSGRYNTVPASGTGQAAGWAVAWQNPYLNSHSATGWSGQYQINPDTGQEEIYTLWLLASEATPSQDWGSTRVGQDTFTRTQPTDEEVARRSGVKAASHPLEGEEQ